MTNGSMTTLLTPGGALQLLGRLGAPPWLLRHHELVLEAATLLCDGVHRDLGLVFDHAQVLVGAALHDAGKITHPEEMHRPGSEHEKAGQRLLLTAGVPVQLARFCITHAAWDASDASVEDLLVALADKLWKGKRVDELEHRLAEVTAGATGREPWAVFDALDALFETIAADGPTRLARSNV